jgi:hypothetical protein
MLEVQSPEKSVEEVAYFIAAIWGITIFIAEVGFEI